MIDPGVSPYEAVARKQLVACLIAELPVLSERERLIMRMHYWHDVRHCQLGQLLSISKARVSQLHREALVKMRRCLANQGYRRLDW